MQTLDNIHSKQGPARRLVQLDMQGGTKQMLEADMVLWTAGSAPASRGEEKLKVPCPALPPACAMLCYDRMGIQG